MNGRVSIPSKPVVYLWSHRGPCLDCFAENSQFENVKLPCSQMMELEASRIILASEVLSGDFIGLHPS